MKLQCLNCGASLVKVKGKYICNNYHRGLGRLRCPKRFTVTDEEIDDILQLHQLTKDEVEIFKVDSNYHYEIILHNGCIKGYDGSTIIM